MTTNLIHPPIVWKSYQLEKELSLNETHLFKISVSKNFQRIKRLISGVVSDIEFEKANRIFSQKDKERYLTSKFFLRTILSKWVGTAPHQVDFITHELKKPTVKGVEFNISHTGDYIIIGVSPEIIGVDLELIDQSFDFESILDITFSKEEIDFIGIDQINPAKFYTLWTRKEAILKAGGEGASNNLHLITCLNEIVSRRNTTFKLHSFAIDDKYVASTAVTLNTMNFNYWQLV